MGSDQKSSKLWILQLLITRVSMIALFLPRVPCSAAISELGNV